MSDTTYIRKVIEPYVREWLERELRVEGLEEKNVDLVSGGQFRFDAVSSDGLVVANILSNRARTATGNENTGGVRKALNDLRFLGMAHKDARRIMVFTDASFCKLIQKKGARMGIESIEFFICKLPRQLRRKLDDTLDAASQEQLNR